MMYDISQLPDSVADRVLQAHRDYDCNGYCDIDVTDMLYGDRELLHNVLSYYYNVSRYSIDTDGHEYLYYSTLAVEDKMINSIIIVQPMINIVTHYEANDRLKQYLYDRYISYRDIVRMTHLSLDAVYHKINGKWQWTLKDITEIAVATHMDCDHLCDIFFLSIFGHKNSDICCQYRRYPRQCRDCATYIAAIDDTLNALL